MEETFLALDFYKIPLGTEIQVFSIGYVQAKIPKYIAPWIPQESYAWSLEALIMDMDESMVYLGTNTWYYSLDVIPTTLVHQHKPPYFLL